MTEAKRCLDFTAGWGDRLTGWLASPTVEEIVLIEPRQSAADAYREQARIASTIAAKKKQLYIFTVAAEDIIGELDGGFDLILSSPPYCSLELYDTTSKNAHMQVSQRYSSAEAYLSHFLFPVAKSCLQKLSSTGIFCINLSDHARKGVKVCQPFLDYVHETMPEFTLVATFVYGLRGNPGRQRQSGGESGIHSTNGEPIYVFCRKEGVVSVREKLRVW